MMRRGLAGGALALMLLAGCSGSSDAPPEDDIAADNIVEPQPLPEEQTPAPPPEERTAPEREPEPAVNTAEAMPEDAPLSVDEQMLEDADAAGLTARTTPDVVTGPPADPVGAQTNGLDSKGHD